MKTNHCYVLHLLKIYYKWHKDWGSEPKHRMMEYYFVLDYSMVQFMFLPFCSHLGTDIVHVHSLC